MNTRMINKYAVVKNSLLSFFLLMSYSASSQAKESLDFSELSEALHQDFAKDFAFSVFIEIDETSVFAENFGHIDKKGQLPVNEKTLFNIASITKSVTAAGIMKLVEQNKISLFDTLGQFFENVPKAKESISISALLSHKSGFKQNYPLEDIVKSDEALQIILNEQLEFTPESGFRYSNQNYQLLALIIEKITQTSYENFIKEEVLIPLNLNDTYFWNEMSERHNTAYINNKISRKIGEINWGWIGATGIFSTAADLSRFWNGIYNDGFLSKESISIIFDTYHQTSSGLQIGLGFFKSPNTKWNTSELWTRGTESWGHNSVIRFFPEKNITIIVSTNSGEFGRNKMTGNKLISDLIAEYLFE